jgi:hypothetical protein
MTVEVTEKSNLESVVSREPIGKKTHQTVNTLTLSKVAKTNH